MQHFNTAIFMIKKYWAWGAMKNTDHYIINDNFLGQGNRSLRIVHALTAI